VTRPLVRAGGYAVLLAVIAVLPLFLGSFRTTQLTYVGVFGIALVGLNVLTGFAGQISLGHGAFMALGAYTTAILSMNHGVPVLLTIPLGGLVAGVAGFLFGFPALRLAGVSLALGTFGLAVVVPSLARRFDTFTGGQAGILLDLPTSPISRLSPERWLYYLTWAIALVLFVVAWVLSQSKIGRAWRAIRDNEIAAAASGVGLATHKTLAFSLSAAYAGVAGSLLAISAFSVQPGAFPVDRSIALLVGLAIGGLGSLSPLVAGAAFLVFLPQWAQDLSKAPGVPAVIYGAILIVVMIVLPGGLGGLLRRIGTALTFRGYSRS
jgi:branched-chain amino acid transport system permease protein